MNIQDFIKTKRADGLSAEEILNQLAESEKPKITLDGRQFSLDGDFIGLRFDGDEKLEDSDRSKLINFLTENTSQSRDFYTRKPLEYLISRHDCILQSRKTAEKLNSFVPTKSEPQSDRSDSLQTLRDKATAARDGHINHITRGMGPVQPRIGARNDTYETVRSVADGARSAYVQEITKGGRRDGLSCGRATFTIRK